mmetsp:Transcript_122619/g.291597  ORF Transcript_122619/g.291597 Transcript_122619/m.291597 type:complete len:217 (-) Transcript_122619:430-1080(-)
MITVPVETVEAVPTVSTVAVPIKAVAASLTFVTFLALLPGICHAYHDIAALKRAVVEGQRLLRLILCPKGHEANTLGAAVRVAKHLEAFHVSSLLEEGPQVVLVGIRHVGHEDLLGVRLSLLALILRLAFAFALVIPSMISVKAEVIEVRTQTQAEALVVQTSEAKVFQAKVVTLAKAEVALEVDLASIIGKEVIQLVPSSIPGKSVTIRRLSALV